MACAAQPGRGGMTRLSRRARCDGLRRICHEVSLGVHSVGLGSGRLRACRHRCCAVPGSGLHQLLLGSGDEAAPGHRDATPSTAVNSQDRGCARRGSSLRSLAASAASVRCISTRAMRFISCRATVPTPFAGRRARLASRWRGRPCHAWKDEPRRSGVRMLGCAGTTED
jgi:hypothetical protein